MIEVPVYNQQGEEIDKFELDEAKLGGEVRPALLKQALVMYHANLRQGSAKTKTRTEVEGSTKKMFRQKGTGNARAGTVRSSIRVGGGHAKQKLPKSWRQTMPRKARQLARNNAILSKIESRDLRILDAIALPEPKTKEMVKVYKALGIERSCLLAIEQPDDTILRSARNIDRTEIRLVSQLNAWDILRKRTLLMTRQGLEQLLGEKPDSGDEAVAQEAAAEASAESTSPEEGN